MRGLQRLGSSLLRPVDFDKKAKGKVLILKTLDLILFSFCVLLTCPSYGIFLFLEDNRKGTKEREGLFQFFGEINEIISTLSWFVSCLMIRYLFKVGKDTSVVFFWSMYTSCTKFCDMLRILCPYIGIRPVSVCTSEMRA